jgi:hypothetical protein
VCADARRWIAVLGREATMAALLELVFCTRARIGVAIFSIPPTP